MAEAVEVATDAPIPYIGKSIDLTNPVMVIALTVALVAGMTLWNMADDWGSTLATRISAAFASLTGYNPSSGESASDEAPIGGS